MTGREKRVKKTHYRYLRYTEFTPAPGDVVVSADTKDVELRHDMLLRKFEYSKALDQVLKPYVQRKKPEYTYSLLYELMRREGLKTALAGRDEKSLLLVMYCLDHGMTSAVDRMFVDLSRKLDREVRYM